MMISRIIILALALNVLCLSLQGQAFYHNVFDHVHDRGHGAVVFSDGSVMTVGSTQQLVGSPAQIWLQLLDPQGDLIWSKQIGIGPVIQFVGLEKNGDNQAMVVYTSLVGAPDPIAQSGWMMVDLAGNMVWSHLSTADLEVRAVTPLNDGYLLTGRADGHFFAGNAVAWKISVTDGAIVWNTAFGTSNNEVLNGCWVDGQGQIFCTGSGFPLGDPFQMEGMLAQLSPTTGALQFVRLYGTSSPEELVRVAPLANDRLLLAGISEGFGDNIARVWLVATNLGGEVVWSKTYSLPNIPFGVTDMVAQGNTEFVIAANDPIRPIGNPAILMKVTMDGNLAWVQQITTSGANPAGERTTLEQVQIAPTGGYVVAGTASFSGNSNLHVAHVNEQGQRPPCQDSPAEPVQETVTILSQSVAPPIQAIDLTPISTMPALTDIFPETEQIDLLSDMPDIDVSFSISDSSMLCPGLCVIVTFTGFTPGVEYSFDPDGATLDPSQLGRICFPKVETYNLKRTGVLGCFSVDTTIIVQVGAAGADQDRVTAFTPNSDSVNDSFRPWLACPPVEYYLTIYDRWGHLVFESREYDLRWDGTINEVDPAPSDAYVWRLEYSTGDTPGDIKMTSGDVSLLR